MPAEAVSSQGAHDSPRGSLRDDLSRVTKGCGERGNCDGAGCLLGEVQVFCYQRWVHGIVMGTVGCRWAPYCSVFRSSPVAVTTRALPSKSFVNCAPGILTYTSSSNASDSAGMPEPICNKTFTDTGRSSSVAGTDRLART